MDKILENKLIEIAKSKITSEDPSHDIYHTLRVLKNAKYITEKESGDLDIIVASAILHDLVTYPKNDPRSKNEQNESAEAAEKILRSIKEFPQAKIDLVKKSIGICSFSKNIKPEFLEAKILQDADKLEATGAISIMRTFASSGIMKRQFYDLADPFCKNREPDNFKYSIDLFYTRLLVVKDRMHTKTGRKIAERRTQFLEEFLIELEM